MRLDEYPRFHLADLPTAIEDAPRLAEAIGVKRLLIKRDDNTGLAMGGNKARKLEFLIADAQAKGADVVFACGGPQSNHVRMTAAAARKAGMDCIIFMPVDDPPKTYNANLLLDAVLGAEIRFIPEDYAGLEKMMAEAEEEMISQGRVPYSIPMGGSTPLGALGYVNAVRELAGQLKELGIESVDMITALGTGGTLSGITLGCYLFSPESRPIGISVVWETKSIRKRVLREAGEASKLLGLDHQPSFDRLAVYDQYIGEGYAIPTQGCKDAILMTARNEGIILDPVYTAKAMDGLIDLARKGEIGQDRPILFWHTGGAPGLFAHPEMFHEEALSLTRHFYK